MMRRLVRKAFFEALNATPEREGLPETGLTVEGVSLTASRAALA